MKKTIIMASAIAAAALLAGCGGKGTRGKAAPETADIPIDMVFVEGGTFTMGCTEEQGGDCDDDEKPTRGVTVSSFYIGKYEVTQALWMAVMGSGHPVSREGEYLPVNNISGDDAQEFIRKLNAKTGKKYRLPTEAEWEYAARGGNKSKGYKYSGGNDIEELAWYKGNSGGEIHPVGLKAPNELGIYDMAGNVWEHVCDWYGEYGDSAQTDPVTSGLESEYRVGRGGSWKNEASAQRVAERAVDKPDHRDYDCGFRLVLSPATEADTVGVWTSFWGESFKKGYMDKYLRVMIEPKFSQIPRPCHEFDNIVGVMEEIDGKWQGYYLTKTGKIVGRDSLYVVEMSADCETGGFIRFHDKKADKIGMFDRNGNVAVPAEYDRLGEVVNGMIIALKDAEEECLEDEDDEHSGCYKTGGNRMVIDTSNNVLIENFPDDYDLYSYDMYLDFLSKEKTKAPHPDTARESFAAKGGGYYSFINLKKEFGRWLANDLEAALKADMRDSGSKKFIGWHITDYWDDYITDSRGKINRREFIVRNYDNLIREARRGEINYESFTVTGTDDEGGHHSYYDYSRIGKGYELSFVTVRSSPLMLNAEIYRTLAKSYSNHHKKYYEAIVYYEKAIESDPDCAAEYYAMEESGKKKGEKAKWEKASGEAAEYFRQIIKPDPAQCAASFYDMGEAYIKNGDESKGQIFKKKAEALGCTPD